MMLSQLLLHYIVQEARKGLAALGPHLWGPDRPWVQQWRQSGRQMKNKLPADVCMNELAARPADADCQCARPADADCQCARPALALAEEEFTAAQRASELAAASAATAHAAELARFQEELAAARDAQDTALAAEREMRKISETQGAAMARAVATASADAENYVSAVREDASRAAAQHRSEMDEMRARVAGAEAVVGAAAAAQIEAEAVAATLRGEWAAMEEASRAGEASTSRAVDAAMLADRAHAAAAVAAEELAGAKAEVSECRRRLEDARAGERRVEEAEATLRASQERARMLTAELAGCKQALARLNATVNLFTGHALLQAADLNTTAAGPTSSSTSLADSAGDATGRPLQLAFLDSSSVSETAASLFSDAVDFGDSSACAVSASLRAVSLPPELSRLRDLAVPDLSDLRIDTSMAVQPSTALLVAPLGLLLLFFCLCTRPSSPRRARSKAGDAQLFGEQPATTTRRGGPALPPRPAEAVEGANCAASPQQLVGKAPPGQSHAAHATHSLDAAELAALKQQLLPTASPPPPPASVAAGTQTTPNVERALGPAAQDAGGAVEVEGGSEYRCTLVATERVRDAWVAYRAFHSWVLAAAAMDAEAALRSAGEDACSLQRTVADLEHRLLKERATFARLTTPGGSVRSAVGSARSRCSAVSEASAEISASLKSLRTNLSILAGERHSGPKARNTPGRLVSVARRLLPRLADHVSPSRILSSMLQEVNLVVAEEMALSGGPRDSPDTRRGSSSTCSALGTPDRWMAHSPSWGQLTSENVHILEKRSSPIPIPEMLARNSAAGGALLAEEQLLDHDHQAMDEGECERDGSQGSEWDSAMP